MSLESFIRKMPKVELHVHLEGSIQPETLLALSRRNNVPLPVDSVEGLRAWYTFTDFAHFVEIYLAISACIRTPDDIEMLAREFLAGQAAQHILYSEVTYTAFTHYWAKQIPFRDQLVALNRARAWAETELGTTMNLIIDIPRVKSPAEGDLVARWAIEAHGDGVVALGLGGPEVGHPPEKYASAFALARAAGLPLVLHAGETVGPPSIWGALRQGSVRIGHGVRCLEDPALVDELRARQVPLEVCPSSNVCLGVAPSLEQHPLARLLAEGLYVTLNSDDPPMFNTTLTDEYLRVAATFGYGADTLERLVTNAAAVTLLAEPEQARLQARLSSAFARVRAEEPLP